MPADIDREQMKSIREAISRLPESPKISIPGLMSGEIQTIREQLQGKKTPALLFEAKIASGLLRDINTKLLSIKDISKKSVVGTVRKGIAETRQGKMGFGLIGLPLRTLTGGFRTIAQAVTKFGTTLGPAGIAVAGLITSALAVGGAMKFAQSKAISFGESLKEFSPSIALITAQRGFVEYMRKLRIGEAVAPEQAALNESLIKLADTLEPMKIATIKLLTVVAIVTTDLENIFFTALKGALADISDNLDEFLPALKVITKLLQDEPQPGLRDLGLPRQFLEALASGESRTTELLKVKAESKLANASAGVAAKIAPIIGAAMAGGIPGVAAEIAAEAGRRAARRGRRGD